MKKTNEFPSGWDERRVREVLEHYENQTDGEAVVEHEAALSSPEHKVMEVPAELEGRSLKVSSGGTEDGRASTREP